MKNGARCPDRIKAPNHPAWRVRKPPKPETRGSNPRGPATFEHGCFKEIVLMFGKAEKVCYLFLQFLFFAEVGDFDA